MDISTLLGMGLALLLMVFGMVFDATTMGFDFGKIGNFIDVPSVLIVLGGVSAILIASYPLSFFKQVPKHIKIILNGSKYDTNALIDQLVELAQTARKNGLLSLEEKAGEIEEPFFKNSVMMIVDVPDSEKIKEILDEELNYMDDRHSESISFYDMGAAMGPAFGMIGTLIGLVNMLKGMDMDAGGSSSIGQDMSVALITTLYGSALANILFVPLAKKLKTRNAAELLYKSIIIEGVLSIQSGDNPKFLREKLQTFIAFSERSDGESGASAGGEGKPKKAKKGKK